MTTPAHSLSHGFNVELAIKYGVEEAILIAHFQYWINHNIRLGRNNIDGRTWTYQSREEIAAHFPYFTYKQVRKITDSLCKKGILIKGCFNKKGFDKTIWYAFKDQEMFTIAQMGNASAQMGNASAQMGTPIPDTIPNTIPVDSSYLSKDKYSEFYPDQQKQVKDSKKVKISFNKEKQEWENITEQDIKAWESAYPSVPIQTQLHRMVEWIKANPKKSNKKNWRIFINNWLLSAEDKKTAYEARTQAKEAVDTPNDLATKNTKHFYDLQRQYPEAFKHCYIKNGYLINKVNGREARVNLEQGAFETLLCDIAGVKKRV